MGTHSIILAWRIPWIEEPGGLHSLGSWGCRRLSDLTLSHLAPIDLECKFSVFINLYISNLWPVLLLLVLDFQSDSHLIFPQARVSNDEEGWGLDEVPKHTLSEKKI